MNPFKFGTIVEGKYFTDRVQILSEIKGILGSANHLVLISPRRFGKSSLVAKSLKELDRPFVSVNLQSISSVTELSTKILRGIFKIKPIEKLKHDILSFRAIPSVSLNPLNGNVDVTFLPEADSAVILEDVFSLAGSISKSGKRLIIAFDEFQEILEIEKGLDKKLRAILQTLSNVNFVFMGSQESMMTEIFEKKTSPFYHFGEKVNLPKLPYSEFKEYLADGFREIAQNPSDGLAEAVLQFTGCHPYYGQQLAFHLWETIKCYGYDEGTFDAVIQKIVCSHDLDYSRLWDSLPRTDRLTLQLICRRGNPLKYGGMPTSTMFSSLKRLCKKGFLNRMPEAYEIEDPFFAMWIGENMM